MKIILFITLCLSSTLNAHALPVFDRLKIIGNPTEAVLIADHENPNLFYYETSTYFVCKNAQNQPQAFLYSNQRGETPYVSVDYELCPTFEGNGGTPEQVEKAIAAFVKATGAQVLPLTQKIDIRESGLWRSLFDQLKSKIIYECSAIENYKVKCRLYGEGGGPFDGSRTEQFDARLLYNHYTQGNFSLNGYFYSKVPGFIQSTSRPGELIKNDREIGIAFWAEPGFNKHPELTKTFWVPTP